MKITERQLRRIIREEIGRDFKTPGDGFQDQYPWTTPEADVQVFANAKNSSWIAIVNLPDGEKLETSKNSVEEAKSWARQQWFKAQRDYFARESKK